eukprot:1243726-Rhodomonas_salina.1
MPAALPLASALQWRLVLALQWRSHERYNGGYADCNGGAMAGAAGLQEGRRARPRERAGVGQVRPLRPRAAVQTHAVHCVWY